MKLLGSLVLALLICPLTYSQSGRRPKEIKVPVPPPPVEEPVAGDPAKQSASSVTAERNQDYRCTDDGTLERIIDTGGIGGDGTKPPSERILSSKETDTRVQILSKPKPAYTKEARRNGIQGFVSLKVLLSGHGTPSRIRVLKGLSAGLTENAIRAACKMKFKPAVKDGVAVSQWVIAEYLFRLSDSTIFRP